jgi:hypothetical protein
MSRPRLGHGQEPEFLKGDAGDGDGWLDYEFAVVRVVPHVHRESWVNVGVVVHSRTEGYLDARVVLDSGALEGTGASDPELLQEYLASWVAVARGDEAGGDIALLPPSERFHWLTAPRSDVIQTSPTRPGRTRDLAAALEELFGEYVEVG